MDAEDLKGIRTEYVKSKIRGIRLTQKMEEYVAELIAIERAIQKGATNWVIAVRCNNIHKDYKEEYMKILKEMDPEKYAEAVEHLKDIKKVRGEVGRRHGENSMERMTRLMEEWKRLGGVI